MGQSGSAEQGHKGDGKGECTPCSLLGNEEFCLDALVLSEDHTFA